MTILRKLRNTIPEQKEEIDIKTQFQADLKSLELLRFCNVLFRFAETLPEGRDIFYEITVNSQRENSFEKAQYTIKEIFPSLADFKKLIITALEIIDLTQKQILFLLGFARTPDNMLVSEQLDIISTLQLPTILEKVVCDFIDNITQEEIITNVDFNKIRTEILTNIKNGNRLSFRECLLVATL